MEIVTKSDDANTHGEEIGWHQEPVVPSQAQSLRPQVHNCVKSKDHEDGTEDDKAYRNTKQWCQGYRGRLISLGDMVVHDNGDSLARLECSRIYVTCRSGDFAWM
jgi:hypothetical protein